MTEEIDVMAALAHPLPRISATAFASAEKRGEFVLHTLLHQMAGAKPDVGRRLESMQRRRAGDVRRGATVARVRPVKSGIVSDLKASATCNVGEISNCGLCSACKSVLPLERTGHNRIQTSRR
jgi:hypothetical protein